MADKSIASFVPETLPDGSVVYQVVIFKLQSTKRSVFLYAATKQDAEAFAAMVNDGRVWLGDNEIDFGELLKGLVK